MSRSSASAPSSAGDPSSECRGASARPPRSAARFAAFLATVPPRNQRPEKEMQAPEPGGHIHCRPRGRPEQRRGAYAHEGDTHDRNDTYRKGASRNYAHPVEKQPDAGQEMHEMI